MPIDLTLPPKLWLPPKPAIIRALSREELKLGFIPGFLPPIAADTALRLTQVLSATDPSGAAFTLPTGIQVGDLIVVFDLAVSAGGDPSAVIPSGFNQVVTVSDGAARGLLSYKIAAGTEGGTSLNGMDSTIEGKLTYVFRGNNKAIASAVPTDVNSQSTGANPTAQVVNASGVATPLIVIGCYGTNTSAGNLDPRTFNPAKDGEINVTLAGAGNDDFMYLAYKIYNSNPADVTIDMDQEGNRNVLMSCYFACA
jgi:hypothetical protein